MNATFSLLSLARHLIRKTVSNKNRVTHATNSTIKLCFSWIYFHLWIILTNFKWLNSCRKPENMRIQEIWPIQKLIHRRQVAGYSIAIQCCIWYRNQSFECSASQMTGFYLWIAALGWNELIILVVSKTRMVIRLHPKWA